MENASKALIMAAEVLIGVLVLSLMVYLFVTFGSSSAEIVEQMDASKLAEFNTQYDKYKGIEDITIYDIVSLANLARENNKYYELDKSVRANNGNYYISIYLSGEGYLEEDAQDLIEIIKESELKKYECQNVVYSNITGRVKKVIFKEK